MLSRGTEDLRFFTQLQALYCLNCSSHILPSGCEIRNVRMAPSGLVKDSAFNYQDIRDDRVYTYFDIKQGESKTFSVLLNASYLGRFYLPMVSVEAMYDATINSRVPGRWIRIVNPGGGK